MELHTDPVCKMKVQEDLAKFKYEYKGKIYYFCAKGCMEKFSREPEKYVRKEEKKEI